jgi:hypothetical protein
LALPALIEPLDALVILNELAREEPAEMIGWLTSAFLADVRGSEPRMAKRDPHSDCRPVPPSNPRPPAERLCDPSHFWYATDSRRMAGLDTDRIR